MNQSTGIFNLPLRGHMVRHSTVLAILGQAIAIAYAVATEDVLPTLVIFVIVLVSFASILLAVRKFPWGALTLMIVATALSRFSVRIGGLNARPEHLILGVVGPVVFWKLAKARAGMRFKAYDWLVLAFVFMQFFSSVVASLDPRASLRSATLTALAVVPYAIIRLTVRTPDQVQTCVRLLAGVGVAEAAYGLICFLSFTAFGTTVGVTADQYATIPGTYGTMFEANLLGAYAAACTVLLFGLYAVEQQAKLRRLYLAGMVVGGLALMISLARAAMAGCLLGFAFVALGALRSRTVNGKQLIRVAAAACIAVILIIPFAGELVAERFSSLDFSDLGTDSSAFGRLATIALALPNILANPVFGNGTNSFRLMIPSQDGSDELWIGSSAVRILHDTGVIGLLTIVGLATALLWQGLRGIRQRTRGWGLILALLGATCVYAVSFQATDGLMLGFPWVQIGLLAAAITTSNMESDKELSTT